MIKLDELKQIDVPKYAELNVKSIWNHITKSENLKRYFPDYKSTQVIERKYIFDVLHTIDSEFVISKVNEVQRLKIVEDRIEHNEVIKIRKDLLKEISNANYFSSKSFYNNLNRVKK